MTSSSSSSSTTTTGTTGTTLLLRGTRVSFPYREPYAVQRLYMERVLESLQTRRFALLESPTGTGKTLCLLCAALAWKLSEETEGGVGGKRGGVSDVAAQQPSSSDASSSTRSSRLTIIYTSRTHSQLDQVIKELRKTSYSAFISTVLLGSRSSDTSSSTATSSQCVHPIVSKKKGTEQVSACESLIANRACSYHEGVYRYAASAPRSRAHLHLGGGDIEDLARTAHFCPYYYARDETVLANADIIFMPYNYLVSPTSRRGLKIEWGQCVVLVDEAHNFEEVCEEAASFTLTSAELAGAIVEVDELLRRDAANGSKRVEGLEMGGVRTETRAFDRGELLMMKKTLCDVEEAFTVAAAGSRPEASHAGSYIFDLFAKAGNQIHFGNALEVLRLLKAMSDEFTSSSSSSPSSDGGGGNNNNNMHQFLASSGGGRNLRHLEKCFSVIFTSLLPPDFDNVMNANPHLANNRAIHAESHARRSADEYFRLRLSSSAAPLAVSSSSGVIMFDGPGGTKRRRAEAVSFTMDFWCFSGALAMRELRGLGIRDFIFTSGTLNPLDSFAASLGVPFPVRLENDHVCDPSHIFCATLSRGVSNVRLNGSYENRGNDEYVRELGNTIGALAKLIPDGMLVFFPSYGALERAVSVWGELNMTTRVLGGKGTDLLVETRGVSSNEILKRFDEAVAQGRGAVLFAVCRGKLSEGMDFSDARARAVVVVGLPFPNVGDPRVKQKRVFLDSLKTGGENVATGGVTENNKEWSAGARLSGSEWYSQSAFRSVNQACGRVIRHAKDFGAIMFLDERFTNARGSLSAWLRPHFKVYNANVGEALGGLRKFYAVNCGVGKISVAPLVSTAAPTPSTTDVTSLTPGAPTEAPPLIAQREKEDRTIKLDHSAMDYWNRAHKQQPASIAARNDEISTVDFASRLVAAPPTSSSASEVTAKPSSAAGTAAELLRRANAADEIHSFIKDCRNVMNDAEYRELKAAFRDYAQPGGTAADIHAIHTRVRGAFARVAGRDGLLARMAMLIPKRHANGFLRFLAGSSNGNAERV